VVDPRVLLEHRFDHHARRVRSSCSCGWHGSNAMIDSLKAAMGQHREAADHRRPRSLTLCPAGDYLLAASARVALFVASQVPELPAPFSSGRQSSPRCSSYAAGAASSR
jgi:hypothetical protein